MENNGNKGFQGGNKGNVPQQAQVKNTGFKSYVTDHWKAFAGLFGLATVGTAVYFGIRKHRAKKAAAAAEEQPAAEPTKETK